MAYQPKWGGSFAGYAEKFVRTNHWRVKSVLEPEDALQECVVVFLRCCRIYGDKVTGPAHFMALYKRLLTVAFIDFARLGRHRPQIDDRDDDDDELPEPIELPVAPLLIALREASPRLRAALRTGRLDRRSALAGELMELLSP